MKQQVITIVIEQPSWKAENHGKPMLVSRSSQKQKKKWISNSWIWFQIWGTSLKSKYLWWNWFCFWVWKQSLVWNLSWVDKLECGQATGDKLIRWWQYSLPINHVIVIANDKPKPDQELEQEHKQKLGSRTAILKRRSDQVYFKLTLNPRTSMAQEFQNWSPG
jgi:hypothetical protein